MNGRGEKGKYLSLGQSVIVPAGDVIGIFDLDNASWAFKTREFLERAEREGKAVWLAEDLPRSFVLCAGAEGERVYLTQASTSALRRKGFLIHNS